MTAELGLNYVPHCVPMSQKQYYHLHSIHEKPVRGLPRSPNDLPRTTKDPPRTAPQNPQGLPQGFAGHIRGLLGTSQEPPSDPQELTSSPSRLSRCYQVRLQAPAISLSSYLLVFCSKYTYVPVYLRLNYLPCYV